MVVLHRKNSMSFHPVECYCLTVPKGFLIGTDSFASRSDRYFYGLVFD